MRGLKIKVHFLIKVDFLKYRFKKSSAKNIKRHLDQEKVRSAKKSWSWFQKISLRDQKMCSRSWKSCLWSWFLISLGWPRKNKNYTTYFKPPIYKKCDLEMGGEILVLILVKSKKGQRDLQKLLQDSWSAVLLRSRVTF